MGLKKLRIKLNGNMIYPHANSYPIFQDYSYKLPVNSITVMLAAKVIGYNG